MPDRQVFTISQLSSRSTKPVPGCQCLLADPRHDTCNLDHFVLRSPTSPSILQQLRPPISVDSDSSASSSASVEQSPLASPVFPDPTLRFNFHSPQMLVLPPPTATFGAPPKYISPVTSVNVPDVVTPSSAFLAMGDEAIQQLNYIIRALHQTL